MANDKLDWFPIYWQRFIIGTLEMNAEEIGAYFLLLIHQWDKGFVPTNSKDLKKISRVSDKKLTKVLEKFEKIGDKYFNDTLEIIRIEQTEKHAKNYDKGIKGANARWHKHKLSITQAMPGQCETDSIRVEESRVEEKREEKNYINIEGEKIFEIKKFVDERFKLQKTNWQKLYPLANIDNCLDEFLLKRAFETFNGSEHFKKAFSIELNYAQEKNSKNKNNGSIKKPNTGTFTGKDSLNF
jgi:uncharacterized protein YdaU (DUF1376 family)